MALIRDEEEREEPEAIPCADCGEAIFASGRGYAFGTEQWLCWQCAERRGGRYDAHRECWSGAPEVGDLRSRAAREE